MVHLASSAVDEVKGRWPLAYADPFKGVFVKLKDHLVKTAELVVHLFGDRLKILNDASTSLINRGRGDTEIGVAEIAYLAGLLHDLGKASTHYLKEFAKRAGQSVVGERDATELKVSFWLHEYVVPALLLGVAYDEATKTSKEEILVYHILAKVIARHHAAIAERHPVNLFSGTNNGSSNRTCRTNKTIDKKRVSQVIEGMCDKESGVFQLLDELKNTYGHGYGRKVLEKIKDYLSNHCGRTMGLTQHLGALVGWGTVEGFRDDGSVKHEYKLVVTLTGFLIVADILVSSRCEDRSSDDELSPAYVDSWVGELSNRLSELSIRGNDWLKGCRWFA